MSGGLLLSAFVVGLIGIPHCATMCAAPCHAVAVRCAGSQEADPGVQLALQGGRMMGYAALGAVLAASVSMVSSWSAHLAALRPLWLLLQVAVIVFGAWLLATGRFPAALPVSVKAPNAAGFGQGGRSSAARCAGAFVLGLAWVLLPCAQLYSGMMVAAMASSPLEGALAGLLFGVPGTIALLVGPRGVMKLIAMMAAVRPPRARLSAGQQIIPIASAEASIDALTLDPRMVRRFETAAVRLAGAALMVSASWMLMRSVQQGWAYLCQT